MPPWEVRRQHEQQQHEQQLQLLTALPCHQPRARGGALPLPGVWAGPGLEPWQAPPGMACPPAPFAPPSPLPSPLWPPPPHPPQDWMSALMIHSRQTLWQAGVRLNPSHAQLRVPRLGWPGLAHGGCCCCKGAVPTGRAQGLGPAWGAREPPMQHPQTDLPPGADTASAAPSPPPLRTPRGCCCCWACHRPQLPDDPPALHCAHDVPAGQPEGGGRMARLDAQVHARGWCTWCWAMGVVGWAGGVGTGGEGAASEMP